MSPLNAVVAAIGELHLEGNITPHAWYQAPALQFANGKANLAAITLLADVMYWYRPTILRDEATGRVVEVRQKFRADKLQKDYKKWGGQFGLTKGQTEDAVHFLRNAGLVTVETRTIEVMGRMIGNVVFLEPVVEAVRAITNLVVPPSCPDDTPSTDETEKGMDSVTPPSSDRTGKGSGSIGGTSTDRTGISPPIERCNTYNTTETSPKTTKKTTTTNTPAPPKARAQTQASVVVSLQMQRDTSSTSRGERSTKPTQSGMTPLLDMLPPVSPPGPSQAPGGLACTDEGSKAVAALMSHGVKPLATAKRLVEKHGEQACLERIAALPFCTYQDAGGYLVAALDKNYDLPMKYLAKREDEARKRQRQVDLASADDRKAQAAETVRREKEEAERRWEALTIAEQDEIERQAYADIAKRPMGARLLEGPIGQQQLRARCLELVMRNDQKNVQKAA